MGKRIIAQARGKGGPRYRAPSFNYKGAAIHKTLSDSVANGEIIDFIKCPGHSAPLAKVKYEDGDSVLMLAAEGLRVGDKVSCGKGAAGVAVTVRVDGLAHGAKAGIADINSAPPGK